VVARHRVPLAALLAEPYPQPAILREHVLDRHAKRRADPGEGIDHEPNQGTVAQSGMRRYIDAVEQRPRFGRIDARALTRDVSRADDLVQNCLTRAVAKQHLRQPGTDLRAWLFTILHNQNVNEVRRSVREGVSVAVEEMGPVLTVQSNAIATLELRDLERAIDRLPQEQRQVILLVGLEAMRYEEVAALLGVPVGTVRSRLSRGRDQLRRLMDMEEEPLSKQRTAARERAAQHSLQAKERRRAA
jgi:RNA polymerase sigma-70 factor (ECF subfamily)